MNFDLKHVFIEIRYSDEINLIDNLSKFQEIQDEHKDIFSQANMDLTNKLFVMESNPPACRCAIQPNRIIMEMLDTTVKEFAETTKKVLKKIIKLKLYKSIVRIGIRYNYSYDVSDMKAASDIIIKTFFNNGVINKLTSNINAPGLKVSDIRERYIVNFGIATGIAKTMQVDNKRVKEDTEYKVVADLDYYVDGNKIIDIIEFISLIEREHPKDLENIIRIVGVKNE